MAGVILFILAVFIAFFIPGNVLLSRYKLTAIQRIANACVIGIMLWAFQGYIFGFLHIRWATYVYLGIFISIQLYFWRKNGVRLPVFHKPSRSDIALILLMLVGVVILSSVIFPFGFTTQSGFLLCCGDARDNFLHLAYIQEVIKNIPPMEPGLAGRTISNYHYGMHVVIGELVRVYNLPLVDTTMRYMPVFLSFLFTMTAVSIAQTLRVSKTFVYWFLFFLCFAGDGIYLTHLFLGHGVSFSSYVHTNTTLFVNYPFGFSIVIALGAVNLFILWLGDRRVSLFILAGLVTGFVASIKVNTGICLLSGLGVLGMYGLYKKKSAYALLCGLAGVVSFILLYPANSQSGGGLVYSGFWRVQDYSVQPVFGISHLELARRTYEAYQNAPKVFLYNLMFLGFYLFAVLGIKAIAFFIPKKQLQTVPKEVHIYLIAACLVGGILGIFFVQNPGGANSMFFFTTTLVLMSFYCALAADYWTLKWKRMRVWVALCLVTLALPTSIYFVYMNVHLLMTNTTHFLPKQTLDAFSYVKDQTPKDSTILVINDSLDSEAPYVHFFTERPSFLSNPNNELIAHGIYFQDRQDVVNQIYQSSSSGVVMPLLMEHNIEYIFLNPKDALHCTDCDRIQPFFENASVKILRVCAASEHCREDNRLRPAITVINPVRGNGLGHEGEDLLASLTFQWDVTKRAGVPATWLFQYGALMDSGITEFAKQEMNDQEFGLLFEIDRSQAQDTNVQFRGQGPWYGSDGLFLNSYDQSERRDLIDQAFGKFKSVFGYYPKTVGAWWIGGDSLSYMQKKYGITAALRAADQFQLDAYSIWGTPWDIPYLASSVNEGMPGASFDESARVVLLQWAVRDPLRGYSDPLYSLQDYGTKGYTKDYVDYLSSIFLQQPFGNMVIGLENGGTREMFEGSYRIMLTNAKEMAGKYDADLLPAGEYAQNYLAAKKVFATKTYVLADDYGSNNQSFWYMSEKYRIAVHRVEGSVSVVDLRGYSISLEEDFQILPNSQQTLRIDEPSFIDTMRFPEESIRLRSNAEPLRTEEADGGIKLFSGKEQLAFFTPAALTLYPEKTGEMKISFERKQPINVFPFLCILYLGYFIVIFIYRKNAVQSLRDYALLSLPLLFAYPFLTSTTTFLFDKKELPLLAALSLFRFRPILLTLYISKLLPFVLLFLSHYFFILRPSGKTGKAVYTIIFILVVLLYAHLPYFPLDRTTYPAVFIGMGILSLCACIPAAVIAWKKKTKKTILLCIITPLIFIASCVLVVFLSRTKLALTLFELDALSTIQNQTKNVIYEEEVDFGVLPVYKAVKPLLYKNYRLSEIMTGRKWRVVQRPENNVLTLSDYANDIIVVPRYLGSDLSGYEMEVLNLRKIFDNAQIAIFEKK